MIPSFVNESSNNEEIRHATIKPRSSVVQSVYFDKLNDKKLENIYNDPPDDLVVSPRKVGSESNLLDMTGRNIENTLTGQKYIRESLGRSNLKKRKRE